MDVQETIDGLADLSDDALQQLEEELNAGALAEDLDADELDELEDAIAEEWEDREPLSEDEEYDDLDDEDDEESEDFGDNEE